jgi:hypothetical protein
LGLLDAPLEAGHDTLGERAGPGGYRALRGLVRNRKTA